MCDVLHIRSAPTSLASELRSHRRGWRRSCRSLKPGLQFLLERPAFAPSYARFTGMLRSTQRRSLKLLPGNQRPQRRSSSDRAIVSSSTDTFFRTGAIDRRGRTSTDATNRRSIADKPESIHDTSCRASGACTAVTPRGSPAGRQRAGKRSAVSVSAPAAIRGAMDRTRGGTDARPWRAAPADRRGGRLVEALNLGRNCRSLSARRDHHRDLSWTRSSASPRVCAKAEQGRKGVIDLAVSAGVENKQFEPHGARRRSQVF